MRQNLSIYEVEESAIKSGPNLGNKFWKVKTNKGQMSIFDKEVAQEIIKNEGKICDVEVEISEKGDKTYKNITAFNGAYGDAEDDEEDRNLIRKKVDSGNMIRNAVDLAIAGKIKVEEIGDKARGLLALQEELVKGGN